MHRSRCRLRSLRPLTWPQLVTLGLACEGQIVPIPNTCNTGPNDAVGEALRVVFNANLEAIDTLIGRLTANLTNTWVLVVGDNGTVSAALQASSGSPAHVGAPYAPNHGKSWNYQLGRRVPLLAKSFSVSGQGSGVGPCAQLIDSVDLWNTCGTGSGPY